MEWAPINDLELASEIAHGESLMDPPARALWNLIRIRPVKWQLPPWGDLGGGFWIVCIIGERVIWYNDIEDGFNLSRYDLPGIIAEYRCNQDELQHTVNALLRQIETGEPPMKLGPPQPLG
jgi:hypothetical protein